MSTPLREPYNKRTAYWRNILRGFYRDAKSIYKSEGVVEDYVVGQDALTFTQTDNIIPRNYSDFIGNDATTPSTLYTVTVGAVLALTSVSKAMAMLTASTTARIRSEALHANERTMARPDNYATNSYIFQIDYKLFSAASDSIAITLTDKTNTVALTGSITSITSSYQTFTSDPIDVSSLSADPIWYLQYELSKTSGVHGALFRKARLVDAGTSGSVTVVGIAPNLNEGWSDTLSKNVLKITPTTFQPKLLDGTASKVLYDGGSGVSIDGSTTDVDIANTKKLTHNSVDIIDGSGNLGIASGKTFDVGGTDIVNSNGLIVGAAKTRQIWSQNSYSNKGTAAEEEATFVNVGYLPIAIFSVVTYADDVTLRLTAGAHTTAGGSCNAQLIYTDSSGSTTETSDPFTNTAYGTDSNEVKLEHTISGGENGLCQINIGNDATHAVFMRRATVELTSKSGY